MIQSTWEILLDVIVVKGSVHQFVRYRTCPTCEPWEDRNGCGSICPNSHCQEDSHLSTGATWPLDTSASQAFEKTVWGIDLQRRLAPSCIALHLTRTASEPGLPVPKDAPIAYNFTKGTKELHT